MVKPLHIHHEQKSYFVFFSEVCQTLPEKFNSLKPKAMMIFPPLASPNSQRKSLLQVHRSIWWKPAGGIRNKRLVVVCQIFEKQSLFEQWNKNHPVKLREFWGGTINKKTSRSPGYRDDFHNFMVLHWRKTNKTGTDITNSGINSSTNMAGLEKNIPHCFPWFLSIQPWLVDLPKRREQGTFARVFSSSQQIAGGFLLSWECKGYKPLPSNVSEGNMQKKFGVWELCR